VVTTDPSHFATTAKITVGASSSRTISLGAAVPTAHSKSAPVFTVKVIEVITGVDC